MSEQVLEKALQKFLEAQKNKSSKMHRGKQTLKQLAGQNAKLANENFVSRAPEQVVNAEREKKAKLEALIENLKLSLENLGK